MEFAQKVYVSVNGVNSPSVHEGCHIFIIVLVPMDKVSPSYRSTVESSSSCHKLNPPVYINYFQA
jgi:hypothetical protein